jgi:hypothetical protein
LFILPGIAQLYEKMLFAGFYPFLIFYTLPLKHVLKVVATNAGGTVTASEIITIKPQPVVTATANDETICLGQMVLITAKGADNYSWEGLFI